MVTPKDIENKMFKVSFRGYNTDEVDNFLQEICDSYLEIYIENKKLRAELSAVMDETKLISYAKVPQISEVSRRIDETAICDAREEMQKAQEIAKTALYATQKRIDEEALRLADMKDEIQKYLKEVDELTTKAAGAVTERIAKLDINTARLPLAAPETK